ncbi:hypothetical protein AJ80_00086 [Polytolypa hystricis UAMH7299]|uniref:HMG box domain-containing protein n=1 Tax=Polytolypa hystricis (strain UAMH7299) TaxID=1447883 RepID=A0A2B7Z2Q7_POLH7|nr:hypothetical protein AJ80_00086 [Polytolypa hystricis UAMH7299]
MADLATVLNELGMAQYFSNFIENGFENWKDVLDITEFDLYDQSTLVLGARQLILFLLRDILGVKLGHRRRLQQRVAKERDTGHSPGQNDEDKYFRKKRRYQWHPKPDPNSPKKPLTAYAKFANQKRAELKSRDLSFPEMAIEIGRLWRELPMEEKHLAQRNALQAREEYKQAMTAYKNSEDHQKHEKYINDWKARKCSRKAGKRKENKPVPPDEAGRSPAPTVVSMDTQSVHTPVDDNVRVGQPATWGPSCSTPMAESMEEGLWWSLSQGTSPYHPEEMHCLMSKCLSNNVHGGAYQMDFEMENGVSHMAREVGWPGQHTW